MPSHNFMRKLTFITGAAGTGKSTQLRTILENKTRPHLICAPTGIAAVNIGGTTIHKAFKIDSQSGLIRQKWPSIEVVFIDEASMMGAELFDYVVAGAPNADLVLVGDMAQLPPVKDKFWFESPRLAEFDVQVARLKINHRQAGDRVFFEILERIRMGWASRADMRWLYSRSTIEEENTNAITIAYRNDTVRAINIEKLIVIPNRLHEYQAVYEGTMRPQDCRAETLLQIKVGAEVIFLANTDEFQNGTRGTIVEIQPSLFGEDIVRVKIGNNIVSVEKYTWLSRVPETITPQRRGQLEAEIQNPLTRIDRATEIEHWLQTGVEYVVTGRAKQYPLKLAYAITVHKSQGMTLDAVNIITSGFAGTHGIGYVALSRARGIDGVTFDRAPKLTDFRFNSKLKEWI